MKPYNYTGSFLCIWKLAFNVMHTIHPLGYLYRANKTDLGQTKCFIQTWRINTTCIILSMFLQRCCCPRWKLIKWENAAVAIHALLRSLRPECTQMCLGVGLWSRKVVELPTSDLRMLFKGAVPPLGDKMTEFWHVSPVISFGLTQ